MSRKMDVALRPLRAEDILQVAEIEKEAFPSLWPSTPFKRDLGNRGLRYLVAWSHDSVGTIHPQWSPTSAVDVVPRGILPWIIRGFKNVLTGTRTSGEVDYTILGLVGLWFTMREAHITTIAVRELMRGRGIGELLLIGSLELALSRQCDEVTLEVRASNHVAQSLYFKYGFLQVGVRKGYYTDNREDAFIMSTNSLDSVDAGERFRRLREEYIQRRGEIRVVLAS